jgi:hypothetical protein
MRHLLRTVLLLLIALPAAADRTERIPVGPRGTLHIELDRGRVEVVSHDLQEVHLEATARGLGASSMEFEVVADARDEVVLRGRAAAWLDWVRSGPRVSVRARVPRGFAVHIATAGGAIQASDLGGALVARTSAGEVRAENVRGPVELETSGGAVRAEDIRGALVARTSGGRIEIGGVRGDVRAVTSGGRILVSRIRGDVEAHTSGGPIEIDGVSGQVVARTSGGAVLTRFTRAPAGSVETSGGGIVIAFPARAGAVLDALTHGGSVHIEHALRAGDSPDSGHVRGTINGGGSHLRLRTSGGSIHVRES